MEKIGAALIRATMLATGAFLGALLARWCDQLLVTRSQKQSDYDKTRYEQGLGPLASQPRQDPS
jgi:hypothetical protein